MYAGMSEARDQNKFLVRMPEGMRERIAEVAKANNRSMNSEIVAALEALYPPKDTVQEVIDMSRRIIGVVEDGSPPKIVEMRDMLQRLVGIMEEAEGPPKK